MDDKTGYAKLRILNCFNNIEEEEEVLDRIKMAGFNRLDDEHDAVMVFEINSHFGVATTIENILTEKGIPFTMFSALMEEHLPIIFTFDGVRSNSVFADHNENAYIDMRAMRSIIDMLEDDLEIKALLYSNEQWVNTDVSTMFRYGMENAKEFHTEIKNEAIQVEAISDISTEEG